MTHTHVVYVVVSLSALTLDVTVRRARTRRHLVEVAHAAPETLADVIPQSRERAGGAWHAHALLRRGATRPQKLSRWAAVTFQLSAGAVRVCELLLNIVIRRTVYNLQRQHGEEEYEHLEGKNMWRMLRKNLEEERRA